MRWAVFIVFLAFAPLPAWAAQDVVNTLHNLSTSGPGAVRSMTVSQVCAFCHTPHNANPGVPLWNHLMSGATYIQYESSTLQASPEQPAGKSRLCLACHDGTVALGALVNPPGGRKIDLESTFLTGRASFGTDLSDDHPISFAYDTALQARNRRLIAPGRIDLPLEGEQLECTTCHDAHEKDTMPFLRKTTVNGELCISCHALDDSTQNWSGSSHATSVAQPTGGAEPWGERKPEWRGRTVAENACFNCHTPHNAVTPPRLIKEREEKTCYLCHDGRVAKSDVRADFLKPYRHPVDQSTGIHDAAEDFTLRPPSDHVECADCHNSHGTNNSRARAPFVSGAVQGVSGINSTGGPVANATNLDEVCYKCHGDNNVVTSPIVSRQIFEMNTRTEFNVANPSHHAVQGPGRNSNVPSLIAPVTENSMIYCTDCHNSDSGPGAGGNGASGPHGSRYRGLLERNYSMADNTTESPAAYGLCYKCHERTSVLGDESFAGHRLHIVDDRAPCSSCHDPHGVSTIQGNPFNNSHLINFDVEIVTPNTRGEGPRFEKLGAFAGQCSLNCHGKDHQSLRY
jgi:predicted CXXCH cytochrome family protein